MKKQTSLNLLRNMHQLSQAEVAKVLKLSPSAYSRLENGETLLTEEKMLQLCEFYRCSLSTILYLGKMNEDYKTRADIESFVYGKVFTYLTKIDEEQELGLRLLRQCLNYNPSRL